jgi:hypothetical protein
MGEFLDDHKRDSLLAILEVFWTFGIMLIPGIKKDNFVFQN